MRIPLQFEGKWIGTMLSQKNETKLTAYLAVSLVSVEVFFSCTGDCCSFCYFRLEYCIMSDRFSIYS